MVSLVSKKNNHTFALIIAHLSLHYFDKSTTYQIFHDIRRLLIDDIGILAFRVNHVSENSAVASTENARKQDQDVDVEDNWTCFEVNGITKQFFTVEKVRRLLEDTHYQIISIEQITIPWKEGRTKTLIEAICSTSQKRGERRGESPKGKNKIIKISASTTG